MTESERQEIIDAVFAALSANSKTIDQLTPVTSVSDSDNLEIAGGRRVSVAVLSEHVEEQVQEALSPQITAASVSGTASTMSYSDIDLASFGRAEFARNGTGPAFFKILRGSRVIGVMTMFSDQFAHQITQIFTTNEICQNGVFDGTHDDDAIHTYRRSYGDALRTVVSGNASWSAWEEQVATSLGDNRNIAVSQKAVTDAINSVLESIAAQTADISELSGRVSSLETGGGGSSSSGSTVSASPQVLPFDGIEALADGTIVWQSKQGASSTPAYYEDISLVFDSNSKQFALKVPNGDDQWTYYRGWSVESYAYGGEQDYRDALSKQNQAVFLSRTDGKIYRYENGTLIATTGSGSGGSGVDQSTVTQLLNADSALSSRITALENAANPLTLSLTRTGSSLVEYTGNSVSVTVTRTAKRGGTTVSSVDSAYTRYTAPSGTSTDLDTTATPTQASTVTISAYGLHSFSAGATVGGMSATASTSVRLELPMYFGFAAASSAASLSIVTLAKKQLAESPKGTVTLNNTTTGHHLWLCVPSRMSISGVTSSGFEVPMSSPVTATTNLGSYKCYRSASDSGLNAGDITITIS